MIELYKKYNENKNHTLIGLFKEIEKKFKPKKILYPGCYVHITPSLIFSDVTYIDSFKNTDKFYESLEVKEFIEKNKTYSKKSKVTFYLQTYQTKLPENIESFDLVISQFGGFVGQGVKKYLKNGGILVCNDSHGDASLANLDPKYELIGIYNKETDKKYALSSQNLNEYFIPKKEKEIEKEYILKTMKGIKYTKTPAGYLFKKIK